MRQRSTPEADGGTRRDVLAGAGLVGLAGVVAACGGSDKGGTAASATPSQAGQSSGAPEQASGDLGKASEIPVGGGKVFPAEKVVVTQPQKGEFYAFTAVCTHMGCTVGEVSGGTINCPCHGSKYSIEDGSVKRGPAPRALAKMKVTVKGGDLNLG
ncbi:Rieske 2Fe-2S domain-containing protein [Actinomadura barringtoniae]|uniref:Cytochrome bc1 complex Rieske iron-sulfur subunit n=1 Tax=Actinomadura barringtoniae TaxID=1427535 RepID=A0A939PCH3_9ACTN|nr:Rieske (2Fe-2S) protein [Actinomadura barringtoniae]MBO2450101.1 Rieske 2Fe-2S domain-containing protein [Actinomadura barringtoniae]